MLSSNCCVTSNLSLIIKSFFFFLTKRERHEMKENFLKEKKLVGTCQKEVTGQGQC
jgi:hypothetical protein